MYPGPNDTDWEVAKFQHRERVTMGLHQQLATAACQGALAPLVDRRSKLRIIRLQVGVLLVRTGQRLQGAQSVAGASSVPGVPGELGSIA